MIVSFVLHGFLLGPGESMCMELQIGRARLSNLFIAYRRLAPCETGLTYLD